MKTKQEWIDILSQIDVLLQKRNKKLELVIIGGSSLILQNIIKRQTEDIDTINKIDPEIERMLFFMGVDINDRARVYEDHFVDWQNEVIDLDVHIKFTNITLKTLTIETIIASKFFTKLEDNDLDAISKHDIEVDREKLESKVLTILETANDRSLKKFFAREEKNKKFYYERGWEYEGSDIQKIYKKFIE